MHSKGQGQVKVHIGILIGALYTKNVGLFFVEKNEKLECCS